MATLTLANESRMTKQAVRCRGVSLTIAIVAVVAVLSVAALIAVMMIEPAPPPGIIEPDELSRDLPDAPPIDAPIADAPEAGGDEEMGGHELYVVPAGRSPIPQPGEDISRPLPTRKLADAAVQTDRPDRPTPEEPIDWHQAPRYIGQSVVVEGEIVNTHSTGNVCFLNFTDNWQGQFYLIVFSEVLDAFPEPPEQYFLNQTVRVKGVVKTHRNRPQIQIRRADQIEIVE